MDVVAQNVTPFAIAGVSWNRARTTTVFTDQPQECTREPLKSGLHVNLVPLQITARQPVHGLGLGLGLGLGQVSLCLR